VSTTAARWRAAVDTSTLLRLLLAFALSFGLWIYVTLRNNPETTIPLRGRSVEARGLPAGSVLMTQLPVVDIAVSGPQTLVENPSQPVRAYIDLTGRSVAVNQSVPIQVDLPAGVSLAGLNPINPREVVVDVEPLTTAQFPVTIAAPLISAPAGVQLPQSTLEPNTVTVTGARSTIARIARVIVQVEAGGLPNDRTRLQRPIPLDLANNEVSGPGLNIEPAVIRVTLPAATTRASKIVPVRYTIRGQPAAGYLIGSIKPTPSSISISGEADALRDVTAVETAPIDITDRRQTLVQDVPLNVPPGVTPEQNSVKVEVGIAPIESSVRLTLPVVPRAQPGLRTQIAPGTVDVTLKGPVPSIQQIDVGSLRAEVDLQRLGPGVHQVEPKIVGPGLDGVGIVEIQPPKVTVTITAEPSATPPAGTPAPAVTPTPGGAAPG
jgi:YbbR domain-containing protein